jgi:polar amino acid transport system substrate-binding protein
VQSAAVCTALAQFIVIHYLQTTGNHTMRRLKIGADPFPPYQYHDADGVLQGSDYQKIKDAGARAGFELDFIIKDWNLIEQEFSQKMLDGVFQLPKTPEREKQYLFSKLLRNGVTEVVTAHPGTGISSINDIGASGYKLGVVNGISYGAEVSALGAGCKVPYPDNETLLAAIEKQEVGFGILDKGVKEFLVEQLSAKNIRAIEALTFVRPLFMAFHEKDIKEAFDKHL